MQDVIKAVLKKKRSDGATYSMDERLAFFWYRYLFLGGGEADDAHPCRVLTH